MADELRELIEYFYRKFPTKRRLVVRRVDMPLKKNYGQTICNSTEHVSTTEGQITVTLDRNRKTSEKIDTLIHEMAHALEFDEQGDHGRRFGKHYSRVYEAWEEWVNGGE